VDLTTSIPMAGMTNVADAKAMLQAALSG